MVNVTLLDFLICFGRSIYRLIGLFYELSLLTFTIPIIWLSQFHLVARITIIFFSMGLILMTMYPQQFNSNLYDTVESDRKLYARIERHIHQGIYPPIIDDNNSMKARKITINNSHDSIILISISLGNINTPRNTNISNYYSILSKEENIEQVEENLTIKFSSDISYKDSFNVIADKLCEMNKEIESSEFVIETGREFEPRDSNSLGNKINCDINSSAGKIIESQSSDNKDLVFQDSSDTFVGINELTSVIPPNEISKIALKSNISSPVNFVELNNSEYNEEEIEKIIIVINPDSASEITEDTVVSEKNSENFKGTQEFT